MGHDMDLVVRGGTIVDGSGGTVQEGDVGVSGGRIVAVGQVSGRGAEEIDAKGRIVTPGFVDIHTHYDGQATWAERLSPSSNHGVTTVVMGNCGVGFAPCETRHHDTLIRLMEGVEDIPGVVLTEGLPWTWETFGDYLNLLGGKRYDMDVAAYLPHAPLRVYAMGQRGADREPATAADIARMGDLAREAMLAGALGFASSRTINHRASDGSQTPSLTASEAELTGIAMGLKAAGKGVLQIISDFDEPAAEFDMIRRIVAQSGRPLSLSLFQAANAPDRWRTILDYVEQANRDGLPIKAQVCGRPTGVLLGFELSHNPFSFCPSYGPIASLPLAERVAALRQPALKARLIAEFPGTSDEPITPVLANLDRMFDLGDPPNYEPAADQSVGAEARRRGVSPVEYVYDLLLGDGGKVVLYVPAANYVDGTIDAALTMVRHEDTIFGLGDGGAHCGTICDASLTTYMLTHWVRDRRGMDLAQVVRGLSRDTARAVGLNDRGLIVPGFRADLNIIDYDRLRLHRPEMVYDLPAGGGRLNQRADGYVATVVNGAVTYRDAQASGSLPGRLVRGPQGTPGAR